MRKMLGVAALVVLSASSAYAQTDPAQYDPQTWFATACPKCGVTAWIDIPSPTKTVSRADLYAGNAAFEGWGFECVSGAPVDRVDLLVENVDGVTWTFVKQPNHALRFGYIYRPDVQAYAVAAGCPNVGSNTGWMLNVSNLPDIALGAHRFQLVIWRGPYHQNRIVTLNITE